MRDGWTESTLGEIAQINPEKTPKWSGDHRIRYVDIASVNWGQPITHDIEPQAFESAPGRARRRIREGDILVSTVRPNLRAMAVVPPELDGEVASTGFAVLRAREGIALPGFVWAVVRHEDFRDDMVRKATGSNYPAVRSVDVASHPVAVPPIAEQRRIASVMGAVDHTIEAVALMQACAAETAEHVAALASQSSDRDPVTELAAIQFGNAFSSRDFCASGLRLLRGDNIAPGALRWEGAKHISLDMVDDRAKSFALALNDLVLGMDRPVIKAGIRVAQVQEGDLPALLVQRVARLRFSDPDVAPRVKAFWQTAAFGSQLLGAQTGGHVPHLSAGQVKGFEIPRPISHGTLGELLVALDRVCGDASTELDRLESLRSNLLTLLMSGEHEIPASYDAMLEATS